eukprot:1622581-Prymnesium_polylepis.1
MGGTRSDVLRLPRDEVPVETAGGVTCTPCEPRSSLSSCSGCSSVRAPAAHRKVSLHGVFSGGTTRKAPCCNRT